MTSDLVMTLLQCSGSDTAGGVQTKEVDRTSLALIALSNVYAASSLSKVGVMSIQAILTPLDVHAAMCATETCRRSWRVWSSGAVLELSWQGSLAVAAAIVRSYAY